VYEKCLDARSSLPYGIHAHKLENNISQSRTVYFMCRVANANLESHLLEFRLSFSGPLLGQLPVSQSATGTKFATLSSQALWSPSSDLLTAASIPCHGFWEGRTWNDCVIFVLNDELFRYAVSAKRKKERRGWVLRRSELQRAEMPGPWPGLPQPDQAN